MIGRDTWTRARSAVRAKCSTCWGHGGYWYHGHWTRCPDCGGSGQS